jgi:hypothetical protein
VRNEFLPYFSARLVRNLTFCKLVILSNATLKISQICFVLAWGKPKTAVPAQNKKQLV